MISPSTLSQKNQGPRVRPCISLTLMSLLMLALAFNTLTDLGGVAQVWQSLFAIIPNNNSSLVLHYAWWPRLAMALLAGSGLALAGVLMQQVLRNPLAGPTTLGVVSGASLALMAATLMAPGLLVLGREWVALAGGSLAMGLVMALAWRRHLAPIVVVLAGLVVNLYFGALALVILLFHQDELKGLLIWGAGALAQDGWSDAVFLAPRIFLALLAALLLLRPLRLLELDDASATSLGVNLKYLRLTVLGIAIFITASIVSVVGMIGFIGLAAPNIVRLYGVRGLPARLLASTLLGALLLAITDLLLQSVGSWLPTLIPTGAATAALGAPLLIWLIPRLRLNANGLPSAAPALATRHPAPARRIAKLSLVLGAALLIAVFWGQDAQGWQWATGWNILEWRLPRLAAATASGILLALAGTLLQRLTANPMASPELLGISGGSAMALMVTIFILPAPGNLTLVLSGTLGALASLAVLILVNRRSSLRPERLLLTGVAITALFEAVRAIMLAGGDPRGQLILAWLSGSTYYVDADSALVVSFLAVGFGMAIMPLSRWLDILPLGAASSRALGIHLGRARLLLLLFVALLTACATMVVGPLSFVGLLAPHMARLMGLTRARDQLIGAALLGALLMVLADWLSRQLLFPDEIPAGVVASLIGRSYFIWRLRRL